MSPQSQSTFHLGANVTPQTNHAGPWQLLPSPHGLYQLPSGHPQRGNIRSKIHIFPMPARVLHKDLANGYPCPADLLGSGMTEPKAHTSKEGDPALLSPRAVGRQTRRMMPGDAACCLELAEGRNRKGA